MPFNWSEKVKVFPLLLARLILFAYSKPGRKLSMGEGWRPPETAAAYAKEGKGISNTLHTERLAQDLNLYEGGTYKTRTEDYRELGEWWEAQSTPDYKCVWGGRFGDGNHFSIEHNGVR